MFHTQEEQRIAFYGVEDKDLEVWTSTGEKERIGAGGVARQALAALEEWC